LLLDAFRRQRFDQAMQILLVEMHKSAHPEEADDPKSRRGKYGKPPSRKSDRRARPGSAR
jgi:hypothetical protein